MARPPITNQIRRLRFEHNEMTQQELADTLGCHQVTVARWESGEQVPRGKRLEALQTLAKTVPTTEDIGIP